MSEEQQQQAIDTTSQPPQVLFFYLQEKLSSKYMQIFKQVITKLEENEQQVKNTEISCAKKAESNSTPVPNSTTYGSVDNEIW